MNNRISEVHNEDNMLGMARYPDGFFDLAIVDPPYGINAPNMKMGSNPTRKDKGSGPAISTAERLRKGRLSSGGGKLKNRNLQNMSTSWDETPPTAEYFAELRRVSKNQIIWGGNYFALPPTREIVCWDKCQPWENFSQWEMAWTSFDGPAAMFRYSNTGGANAEKKIHPTQKPVALYKWLLANYAKPGDKILDTHLGSGSSRIAAWDMGFDFYAWELDKDYFDAQEKRFRDHVSRPALFSPAEQYPTLQLKIDAV
jgi:site-specific DNA-methyltransferase (adenine-specific)